MNLTGCYVHAAVKADTFHSKSNLRLCVCPPTHLRVILREFFGVAIEGNGDGPLCEAVVQIVLNECFNSTSTYLWRYFDLKTLPAVNRNSCSALGCAPRRSERRRWDGACSDVDSMRCRGQGTTAMLEPGCGLHLSMSLRACARDFLRSA